MELSIENQTPEICLAAVKKNYYALKFVKKQTEEICLAAVMKNINSKRFVNVHSPEIDLYLELEGSKNEA